MGGPEPLTAGAQGRHPLVDRILAGDAPEMIRLSAARGALPIPQLDLVYVQVCLLRDALPAVVQAATDSLTGLTGESLLPVLKDGACDPIVIDHFARSGHLTGPTLEAAIAHPAIPDGTLESLAAGAPAGTLDLIVTNEVRIIRNPRLLQLLRANPALSTDNRRRLAELERDFVGKDPLEVRRAQTPAPQEAAPESGAEAVPIPVEGEEEATQPVMTPEEMKNYEEGLRRTPAFMKIMQMSVAERIQLAMKGNAEERAVLIHDTARMVAQQVLKSPKLSDHEITFFANMRSIHEDVLREIAGHRDWTKIYTVAHALVRNPKTPPGLTIQFLPRLGTRDLKMVMGDRNIPELVRRQAHNIFLTRTTPPKKLGKKSH